MSGPGHAGDGGAGAPSDANPGPLTRDGWLPYRIVDAFTEAPFQGNPAAVVLPPDLVASGAPGGAHPIRAGGWGMEDGALQALAAEMNLSETAFPGTREADGTRRLRWFTPTTEVSLCGHATLAAAHAMLEAFEQMGMASERPESERPESERSRSARSGEEGAPVGEVQGDTPAGGLRFSSRSGPLEVHREADGRLRLDFPLDPPVEAPLPHGLREALGLGGSEPALWAHGARCAVLELSSEARVSELTPDFAALGAIPLPPGVMGISVTARAAAGGRQGIGDSGSADFVSRFFGPWVGVDEDPVTGMAHCVLAPWWGAKLGTRVLQARQWAGVGPRRRGGALEVRLVDGTRANAGVVPGRDVASTEAQEPRVHLIGRAVTVAQGWVRRP
jgi:predicted PhzF superfamily epimerase YddE/YHI9